MQAAVAQLQNEIGGSKPLASSWHFVIVDGFDCAHDLWGRAPGGLECDQSDEGWPAHVEQAWNTLTVKDTGLMTAYECRRGRELLPGWCLGALHNKAVMPKSTPSQPHLYTVLSSESYLGVNDRLESDSKEFYLTMQEDGNLVIYTRTDGTGGWLPAIRC